MAFVEQSNGRHAVRPQLGSRGTEGIGGLQSMPSLHTLTTILAVTDVNVELALDRFARDVHLILGHHHSLLDVATAMRASFRQRRLVGLVDLLATRSLSVSLLPVRRPRFTARFLGRRSRLTVGDRDGRALACTLPGFQ